jgi:hypothetical protein
MTSNPPAGKPNFFIVGAPKAGTTAFYLYLKQHPEVFLPESAKEPHFFAPELKHPAFVQDPRAYAGLFSGAQLQTRVGEASVFYLYSRRAAGLIRDAGPEARIIIMLRNPVDMIYALHNEHFTNGIEKYRRFEDALAAERRREAGTETVPHQVSPELYLYRKIGLYSSQVERYLDCFPEEQVLFVFFEDFVADVAAQYRRALQFLGVDAAFQPEFPRVNESRHVRNRTLQRILLARPAFVQKAARALSPEKLRHRILNFAFHLNAPIAKRPPLDPRTRDELSAFFGSDVQKLSRLVGRDLSSWTNRHANAPVVPSHARSLGQ